MHFFKNKVNYAGIDWESTVNGDGFRSVLYLQGCEHHCKDCHNKETWNPKRGLGLLTKTTVKEIIEHINGETTMSGITLSGGDPFYNLGALKEILTFLKENLLPGKTIWCYTGYTYEELEAFKIKDTLKMIDVLVDGKYIKELNENNHKFRGSANQRILKLVNGEIA